MFMSLKKKFDNLIKKFRLNQKNILYLAYILAEYFGIKIIDISKHADINETYGILEFENLTSTSKTASQESINELNISSLFT